MKFLFGMLTKGTNSAQHKSKPVNTRCWGGYRLKVLMLILVLVHKLLRRQPHQSPIVQNRFRTLLQVLYLLLPVAFTSVTLSLSWRGVYFTSRSINMTLAQLQIAAKLHDVLIALSLSEVLLYHLRNQLTSERGTNFGLFSVAYSIAVGSFPSLEAFWHPFYASMRPGHVRWHTRILVYFVLLVAVIGLAANPAASVALLPRLDWWPSPDFFSYLDKDGCLHPLSHAGFSMYVPKRIFPIVVNASSLPVQDRLASDDDNDSPNPSTWANDSLSQYLGGLGPAFSLLNNTLGTFGRNIIASGLSRNRSIDGRNTRSLPFRTDTLITHALLADYLSLSILSYPPNVTAPSDTAGGPWTLEANLPGDKPRVPRAMVWCDVQPAILTLRNLSSIFGNDSTTNPFLNQMVDLTSIWNENTLNHPNQTLFEWVELPQANYLIAGLILMPSNQSGSAKVTVCTVQAAWSTTSMWIMPEQHVGGTMSNFTYSYPRLGGSSDLFVLPSNVTGYSEFPG